MTRSSKIQLGLSGACRMLPLLALGLAVSLTGCKNKNGEPPANQAAGSTSDAASPTGETASQPGVAAPNGGQPGALPPGEGALDTAKLPETVADVNGAKITKTELIRGAQTAQAKRARVGQRVSLTADFYKQVLDELIADHVLQQEAQAAGFSAQPAEVDARLAMIKARLPSEDAYKQILQANGVSDERFRESLSKGIQVEKYVAQKLVPAVTVTDDQARAFYDNNKPQFAVPEQVHLRHILIRAQGTAPADKEKAKEKAEELLKKVQGGADFAQVAAESSDDPGTKGRGGDLGWLPRGKTPPAFEKAVFALTKPNELSPVVETDFGFHVIQLLERKQPSVMEFEQVKPQISHLLQERQALDALRGRIKVLRDGGKVKTFL